MCKLNGYVGKMIDSLEEEWNQVVARGREGVCV